MEAAGIEPGAVLVKTKGGGHLAPPGTRYRGGGFTRSNEIAANFGSRA